MLGQRLEADREERIYCTLELYISYYFLARMREMVNESVVDMTQLPPMGLFIRRVKYDN